MQRSGCLQDSLECPFFNFCKKKKKNYFKYLDVSKVIDYFERPSTVMQQIFSL